ncbi:broad specificity phosphatase PhoE [Sphingomonas leidyi]|uniref:Broad specificity phosphatase PhoE n=1 Tax=Sphingomonas leidyi TaxID=68569 RepID=A0A7X5ZYG5_9SPHN|nr:hypothetical protein [Sphingomonas leidyi]NIJ67378.1 broad specificity phosphatase PhoE [Sphingomonas leidyi]
MIEEGSPAQCWLTSAFRRDELQRDEQRIIEFLAQEREWQRFRDVRGMSPEELQQFRRNWYGSPPWKMGERWNVSLRASVTFALVISIESWNWAANIFIVGKWLFEFAIR